MFRDRDYNQNLAYRITILAVAVWYFGTILSRVDFVTVYMRG